MTQAPPKTALFTPTTPVSSGQPTQALAVAGKADQLIAQVQADQLAIMGVTQQVERMSLAIRTLRETLTDEFMRQHVMPLMGTQVGFRTDKVYDVPTVRECAIVALIRGARLVNNEFNIIAGNTYFTKEYFQRRLSEMPGLTDLRLNFGVPKMVGDRGAIVACSATWLYSGVADRLDAEIPVRNNANMGIDALLGKAERKFRARIYNRLTGSDFTTDGEIDETPEAATNGKPSDTQASIDALKGQAPGREAAPKDKATEPKPEPTPSNVAPKGERGPTDEDLAAQPPWSQ